MEAIKTVEYLCQLLGKTIKPLKVKQFIGLLTEKVILSFSKLLVQGN